MAMVTANEVSVAPHMAIAAKAKFDPGPTIAPIIRVFPKPKRMALNPAAAIPMIDAINPTELRMAPIVSKESPASL